MSEEKPLHVRVAEALGWTDCTPTAEVEADDWEGVRPNPCGACGDTDWRPIPLYDTDWSATGPLIQRFKIGLECTPGGHWEADTYEYLGVLGRSGDTPLIAACNLLLALHAAGRLPR